jgi:hypothetical protein
MNPRLVSQSFLGPESDAIFSVAKVGIAGLGGGGSQVAQQLAHVGVGNFVATDDDVIEERNYLHDKCCYEETNPPKNPWYRATAENSPENAAARQSAGRAEGYRAQRAQRRARRHHGAADRAQRHPHHGLQQSGRAVRVSQAASRLVHLAHRKAAAVPAPPARRCEDRRRDSACRHRARTALRDGLSSPCAGHPASAHRLRMAVESTWNCRGKIYLQPQLRQWLSFLSADPQEPARRTQPGPDGVPHDAPCGLPAHQPCGRTWQS